MQVIFYPHTHWDREWYQPAARLRQRLVAVLDQVVDILERDRAFRCFVLDGQAVLVEDYLAVRPEARARVRRLVSTGRLVVGPWFILADELLSSDECLTRNLLLGRRIGRALGGWMRVGYSPDAFGHPAALPAILSGFGIRHAIVWRGYGGEPGQDRDLFRWVAPDGSAVLAHHLPRPGYEIGASLPAGRRALRQRWRALEGMLRPRAADGVLLVPAGADHHAPDPELPRRLAALRRIAPRERFRMGSPAEYFTALPRRQEADVVEGELRFSYRYTWTLQGVASTRAGLKRAVSETDRLLVRWAEPQAALAALAGAPDRRALLRAAWRDHLLNHFHDSLAGSVSDEVAADARSRARDATAQARGILDDAAHDRLGQDRDRSRQEPQRWSSALVVLNPQARPVRQVVEATVTVFQRHVVVGRPDRSRPPRGRRVVTPVLRDATGRAVRLQVLGTYPAWERLDAPAHYPDQDRVQAFRVAIDPGMVPALGARALRVGAGRPAVGHAGESVRATRRGLAGSWTRVVAAGRGGFRWRHRDGDHHQLVELESERDEGDTYTFDPVAGDGPRRARWVGSGRAVWRGPLVAAIERDWVIPGRAGGTVAVRLDAGSRLLRVIVSGANQGTNHRLRVILPLPPAAGGRVSLADMQYGPVARRHVAHDRARFAREWPVDTAPMHRWVSVPVATARSGRPTGLTVMSRGAFEYELRPDGCLAVTVARSVGELSRGDLRARPGHAAWPMATPGAQEPGPFRLELGLTPLAVAEGSPGRAWDELQQLAEEFHAAPAGLMLRHGIGVPERLSGPVLEGVGLAFRALKPREHGAGIVARCVNLSRDHVAGAWRWPYPLRRAFLARLDESFLAPLPLSRDRRQLRFSAGPRAIVTVVAER